MSDQQHMIGGQLDPGRGLAPQVPNARAITEGEAQELDRRRNAHKSSLKLGKTPRLSADDQFAASQVIDRWSLPEVFRGFLASRPRRFIGYLFDSLFVAVVASLLLAGLLWLLRQLVGPDPFGVDEVLNELYGYSATPTTNGYFATAGLLVLSVLPPLLVNWALMARMGPRNGQTLGKQIVGVRVGAIDGRELSWGRVLKRELFGRQIISILTAGLFPLFDALCCLLNRRRQSIHDLIAGTVVTDDSYSADRSLRVQRPTSMVTEVPEQVTHFDSDVNVQTPISQPVYGDHRVTVAAADAAESTQFSGKHVQAMVEQLPNQAIERDRRHLIHRPAKPIEQTSRLPYSEFVQRREQVTQEVHVQPLVEAMNPVAIQSQKAAQFEVQQQNTAQLETEPAAPPQASTQITAAMVAAAQILNAERPTSVEKESLPATVEAQPETMVPASREALSSEDEPRVPTVAGWYPDPGQISGVRWWNGRRWTENRRVSNQQSKSN